MYVGTRSLYRPLKYCTVHAHNNSVTHKNQTYMCQKSAENKRGVYACTQGTAQSYTKKQTQRTFRVARVYMYAVTHSIVLHHSHCNVFHIYKHLCHTLTRALLKTM